MGAKTRYVRLLILSVVGALAVSPGLALEVPFLTGRVNDHAGLLSPQERERLETTLTELEQATSAQLVVLAIPSLEGEVLEEYSLRVAQTWQLGQRGRDDGVLFLIVVGDRQMRLEVGYGLEGTLTDATSRRILDNVVRPRFRAGDFPGGIEAGVQAISAAIRGDEVSLAKVEAAREGRRLGLLERLLGILIVGAVLGVFSLSALFTEGFGGWFQYLFLIPFWAVFPNLLLTPYVGLALLFFWLIGFPILKVWLGKTASGKAFLKAHPRLASIATAAQKMASSRSSGGFSGRGGSFGGGGASSRW